MRLALVLLAALTLPARAEEPALSTAERTERARAHFERGKAHFNLGEYQDAVREFEAGYREKPQPLFLYNIANAARHAGMQRKALDMFKRYLQEKPDAVERAEVLRRIAELEPVVASLPPELPPPPPQVETPPPPPVETPPPQQVETPPPQQVETPPPEQAVAPPPVVIATPPPPMRSWRRDWLGATLAVLGGAALIVGAVELGMHYPAWERRHDSLDAWHDAQSAAPHLYAGEALLPIGALLLAGGGLRYGLEARRQRRAALHATASSVGVEF